MSVVWFKFDLHYFFFWLNNILVTLKNIFIFIDNKIHWYLTCSKRYETTLSWFVVYKQLSGFLWQLLQIESSSGGSSNLPKSDDWWSADSKLIPKSHGLKSSAVFYLHHAASWLLVWSQCQALFGEDCKLTDDSVSAVSIFFCSKLQRTCINACLISLLHAFEDSCWSFYIARILFLMRGWNFSEHIPLLGLWLPLPMASLIFTTVKFPQHIPVVTFKDTFSPANDFVWAD